MSMHIFLLSPLQAHNNDFRSPTEENGRTYARTYWSLEKSQGILRVCLALNGPLRKMSQAGSLHCIHSYNHDILFIRHSLEKTECGGIIQSGSQRQSRPSTRVWFWHQKQPEVKSIAIS